MITEPRYADDFKVTKTTLHPQNVDVFIAHQDGCETHAFTAKKLIEMLEEIENELFPELENPSRGEQDIFDTLRCAAAVIHFLTTKE